MAENVNFSVQRLHFTSADGKTRGILIFIYLNFLIYVFLYQIFYFLFSLLQMVRPEIWPPTLFTPESWCIIDFLDALASLKTMFKIKGILHQKIFYCLNLIFWIIMGCGIARFGWKGLKTTET